MVGVQLGRFGDQRLACVGGALLAAMQRKRSFCVHRLGKSRNQAIQFGRFLANPAVSLGEMLATAARQANGRAAGRHVLAIMDTTDLRFPTHEASKRGFGRDANDLCPGLFLHPVVAVDADSGGVIGLVDCTVINRTEGKVTDHKARPADEKESRRWLHGAEIAGDRLDQAATITMVGDRESDIYDLFARRPANVHLLCRSGQARATGSGVLLAAQGRETIEVPPKGSHKARQGARSATVALRFGAVTLMRPTRPGVKGQAKTVSLWVVDVSEVDPPAGAEPLQWRLLTTHAISTLAEARQIVAWYRLRWIIEPVFRALKSHGPQIEASQVQAVKAFSKLAIIALIAALRAMQLVLAGEGTTGQAISDAANPQQMPALQALNASLEGRTAKLKNPHDPGQLA